MAAEVIFADGRPFGLFESPLMKQFLRKLSPTFDPPDRKAVAEKLLSIYRDYKRQSRAALMSQRYIRWFGQYHVAPIPGPRLQAPPAQSLVPRSVCVYGVASICRMRRTGSSTSQWKYLAQLLFTGKPLTLLPVIHSAENCVQLILPELEEICHGKFSRINAFCTDTASVMRKTHTDLARMENFRHRFFSLCDSHGLSSYPTHGILQRHLGRHSLYHNLL